jgi:hypothetical protein
MASEHKDFGFVCGDCVRETYLARLIASEGDQDECDYCGEKGVVVELRSIADRVLSIFPEDYRIGEAEPEFDFGDADDEPTVSYSYSGDSLETIVADLLDCDEPIAEAVAAVLREDEFFEIDESRWSEVGYEEITWKVHSKHHGTWNNFVEVVRGQRRFFHDPAVTPLRELLGNLDGLRNASQESPILMLNPENGSQIFRARSLRPDHKESATRILNNPSVELGAPPSNLARGGRMNPPGISVFYGGFSEAVCVAEVRPPVGGALVLGAFDVVKPLRLLDLTFFDTAPNSGSSFDPKHREILERWRFLRHFHFEITQPVLPEQEELDYVSTQVVAEFIRHELQLDGIVYSSAQVSGSGLSAKNVALFAADTLIEPDASVEKKRAELDALLPWGIDETASRPPSLRFRSDSGRVYSVTAVAYTTMPWGHEDSSGDFWHWRPATLAPSSDADEISADFD